MYRIVKWAMTVVAVLYLPAALFLPALDFLRGDALSWVCYGAFVLLTAFVWGIGGKANRTVGRGVDRDEVDRETRITQEVERSKAYWSQM